jgi:hypothetical protein
MSLKRYKLLITLVLPLLFLSACADKSVEVANNTTVQTASESKNSTTKYYDLAKDREYILPRIVNTGYNNNTDPLCKIYVDALNTYGTTDDFFEAPIQPNSPKFGYPKWEQLDIYEYLELYRKARQALRPDLYPDILTRYDPRYDEFINKQAAYESILDPKINDDDKTKGEYRKLIQMYYARADIDNDGVMDDIIRIDTNRYSDQSYGDEEDEEYSRVYTSSLIAFDGKQEKTLKDTTNDAFDALYSNHFNSINNFFFYKGKTYIKSILHDILEEDGFIQLLIEEIDKHNKYGLSKLCQIRARGKSRTNLKE